MNRDIADGSMYINMCCGKELLVENFSALQEYTPNKIRLTGKHDTLIILGEGLYIESYGTRELKIVGFVEHIQII